jgi:hypothetical protein
MLSNSNSFATTPYDLPGCPEPWIFRATAPIAAQR